MYESIPQLVKAFQIDSWKQVRGLILSLAIIALGVTIYERWTATFRLSRLDKAASILDKVVNVGCVDSNQAVSVSNEIITQLRTVISNEKKTHPTHTYISKFIVGLVPWFLFAITLKRAFFVSKKNNSEVGAFWPVVIFGMMVSLLAMFLPEMKWPWAHIAYYPLAVFVAFVGIGTISAGVSKSRINSDKEKKPEQGDGD